LLLCMCVCVCVCVLASVCGYFSTVTEPRCAATQVVVLLLHLSSGCLPQTSLDLREQLKKYSSKPYGARLADLHLLLWLAGQHLDQVRSLQEQVFGSWVWQLFCLLR
jgi:hypothetical protein